MLVKPLDALVGGVVGLAVLCGVVGAEDSSWGASVGPGVVADNIATNPLLVRAESDVKRTVIVWLEDVTTESDHIELPLKARRGGELTLGPSKLSQNDPSRASKYTNMKEHRFEHIHS